MIPFKSFLEEKYAPLANLLQSEENRRKLMKLGVSQNSKLVRITKPQAIDNEEDLILFANIFPTGEEKLGKVHLVKGKAGDAVSKARQELAKKTDVPSTWIGYKKGDSFEVWRPVEAGIARNKKSCVELSCLYDSDFAYKVVNPRREELTRKFRQENPGRKEWIEGGSRTEGSSNLLYKMYKNKLLKLLDVTLDYVNKKTLDAFDEYYGNAIKSGKIEDSKFEYWEDSPVDRKGQVSSILSMLSKMDKEKNKIDKKKIEDFISKVEKEIR